MRVAVYARVSTEHEAQINALENQLEWYKIECSRHSDWEIVEVYVDQGITGTQAQKRPEFLRMMEDAQKGKFDLIITREVSRFARNTVDTLSYTRELKARGVDVFFINDGINTATNDGELRLTIMSSMAQDESRKISERVKAGQKISREKHVLYGSGNILGYRRENGTYVPDPDQAETVRLIFQMYSTGENGLVKIVNELYRLGRLDAGGHVSWDASKVNRVLHNATYKGCICYNKSHSDGYLTQKRVKNLDESSYIYVKGDFEPLVSEEMWDRCQQILASKSTRVIDENGKKHKYMFKNQELNKKGAQLLFSSHDLTTMKNTVFRRDEIWFAAMNDNHESEIYSLYEFRQEDNTRVKSTAAFDKQYLEGRYGADPYLSNMLTGRDWA